MTVGIGNPAVRLHDQRQFRCRQQSVHQRSCLRRPEGAVDPDGRHAESFQCCRHTDDIGPRKGPSRMFKAHRCQDGKIAVFAGRKNGIFEFRQIGLRFDDDQIDTGRHPRFDLFLIQIIRPLGRHIPRRCKQRTDWPDIQGHVNRSCTVIGDIAFPCPPRTSDGGMNQGARCRIRIRTFVAVGTKRVCRQHVHAAHEIVIVYRLDKCRLMQYAHIGRNPQIRSPPLDFRTHRSVNEYGLPGKKCTKWYHGVPPFVCSR